MTIVRRLTNPRKVKDANYKARYQRGNAFKQLNRLLTPTVNQRIRRLGKPKENEAKNDESQVNEKSQERKKMRISEKNHDDPLQNVLKTDFVLNNECGVSNGTDQNSTEVDDELLENLMKEIVLLVTKPLPDEATLEKVKSSRQWNSRADNLEEAWASKRNELHNQIVAFEAMDVAFCVLCHDKLLDCVRCKDCNEHYCGTCDQTFHFRYPFHKRFILRDMSSRQLLPTEFYEEGNKLITRKAVPVPCFTPGKCNACDCPQLLIREAGTLSMILVTMNGRFDLSSAKFKCSTCFHIREATIEEYIISGFWPGNPIGDSSYFFDASVLEQWYLEKHNTPGTSELKFVNNLEITSKNNGRVPIINPTLFRQASREYDFFVLKCDMNIKRRDKTICYACGPSPLALHPDGNRKLTRYCDSAEKKVRDGVSLLGNLILRPEDEVNEHVTKINDVIPQAKGRDTCGNSVYKAGKSDSSAFKNQDETGLLMASCRHGCVLIAVNMFAGENYRIVHYVHYLAFKMGCKFICYDVVCKYWPFAETVGEKIKLPGNDYFRDMIIKMIPILSRMHGSTHDWKCQLKNTGHWKSGVAATTGEEQEQSNAKMSRYANSTKYMGKATRNDHLSHGILHWNHYKEERMAKHLRKRLMTAIYMEKEYEKELSGFLNGKGEKEMLQMASDLIKEYSQYRGARQLKKLPQSDLEDELEGIYWLLKNLQKRVKSEACSSKARAKLRRKESLLLEKAEKIFPILNCQCGYKVTKENLIDGVFPWQPVHQKFFRERFELVDCWMLWMRYKEEIVQVKKEMFTYLKTLMAIWSQLKSDIEKYRDYVTKFSDNCSNNGEALFKHGKATIAASELRLITEKIGLASHYFNEQIEISWHELEDALEDEDDEAIDAFERDIEAVINSLVEKEEENR